MSSSTINSDTDNSDVDKRASGSTDWPRYMAWYLLTLLLTCALVAGFNAIVDPHARLLMTDEPDFNQVKVALRPNSRKGKATALRQCDYDTIILGTSRAETAISVGHPALSNLEPYNAALRGGTMYEMHRMADYAIRHQDLKVVLLSLDFEAFNDGIIYTEDFPESPLAKTASVDSFARYLFSLQTLRQSITTLLWNTRGKPVMCVDRGMHKRTFELEAARVAFDFILRRYTQGHYGKYVRGDMQIQHLAAMLRELSDADVKVYAFISPTHVTHIELMTEIGLLDDYQNWKRNLVQVFTEANRGLPEQQQATLWDFSGYSEITTEKVPSPPDVEKFMRWYEDSSHFNSEVGNLMLDRIYSMQSTKPVTETSFGVQLTPENIEEVIETERRDSERYRRDNADEITRMQDMLRTRSIGNLSGQM